jgi:hypothetical protein
MISQFILLFDDGRDWRPERDCMLDLGELVGVLTFFILVAVRA